VAVATPMRYYAQTSATGGIQYRELPPSIGILESLDSTTAIGTAVESGSSQYGKATWKLTVRGTALSGRFVIVDREFKSVME
jgi:hypothetical protein